MKDSSFFMLFQKLFSFIFILILFISVFFIPVFSSDYNSVTNHLYTNNISNYSQEYIWPLRQHFTITSSYGKRISPTAGASSFHKGIDISAPESTELLAVADGTITFTNFLGDGGYTITLSISDSTKVSYCHVSPNYIVHNGDFIKQGSVIGHVGPKNVYGVLGNKYKDANGRPTNGATTGPHLHIGFRINGNYENPLNYIKK